MKIYWVHPLGVARLQVRAARKNKGEEVLSLVIDKDAEPEVVLGEAPRLPAPARVREDAPEVSMEEGTAREQWTATILEEGWDLARRLRAINDLLMDAGQDPIAVDAHLKGPRIFDVSEDDARAQLPPAFLDAIGDAERQGDAAEDGIAF